jgi:hypothetical protein
LQRALNWKMKGNVSYCQQAFERSLELIDLTLEDTKEPARFREISRVREALVDYFSGENQFMSTERLWRRYFSSFTFAARKNC